MILVCTSPSGQALRHRCNIVGAVPAAISLSTIGFHSFSADTEAWPTVSVKYLISYVKVLHSLRFLNSEIRKGTHAVTLREMFDRGTLSEGYENIPHGGSL